jgi:hypothetical protein
MPHNPHIANGDQIYEVSFAFVTSEGDYRETNEVVPKNRNAARILVNFNSGTNESYDTSSYCRSHVLGHVMRETMYTYLSCVHTDNPPKVMKRPTSRSLSIAVYNMNLNTNATLPLMVCVNGALELGDMSPYFMILSFKEI